ncbi:hypothetical protein D6779_04540 [Candidatus Parcubacteria bacterium]|nr:MAG: hypothetical protein D6779_04540 [Candidatus Parcubacteria bacterium]
MSEVKVRKIVTELNGESVISFEVLKAALQLNEVQPKREGDAKLIEIALLALENALDRYETQMNKKYPSAQQLEAFLRDKDRNMPIL